MKNFNFNVFSFLFSFILLKERFWISDQRLLQKDVDRDNIFQSFFHNF